MAHYYYKNARKRFYPQKTYWTTPKKKTKTVLKNILLIYQMLFDENLSDQLEIIAVLKAIMSVWRW